MHYSLFLKIFFTVVLLGFAASAITLWVIRSSLSGMIHVAHRSVVSLPHTRLPFPRK